MTGTLWAFGDSYTLGHELGSNISHNDVRKWLLDQVGVSSVDAAITIIRGDQYHTKVVMPWYEHISSIATPELSYAGVIASKLSLEYINKAECGTGVDFSFHKIMEDGDNIDWDNDIVIFGVPPFNRWLSHDSVTNCTYRRMVKSGATTAIPHLDSLYAWNISLLHTLQTMFPKINIVNLGENLTPNSLETIVKYKNRVTITDMVDEHVFGRYPGFHPTEAVHEQFANYLIKEVL